MSSKAIGKGWNKGGKLTEEWKKKISVAHKGIKFSKEHLINLSLSHKGKKLTEAQKKKIGDATRGKKRKPFSEEWKRNISKGGMREKNSNWGKHHSKERKLKMSLSKRGEKNYNWQGGKSFEPYAVDWTRSLKISIRERDKYTCQVCGEKQGDIAHHVHHIDYDKKNCNQTNLITLCIKCHMKTNFNRELWKKYFNNKFYE